MQTQVVLLLASLGVGQVDLLDERLVLDLVQVHLVHGLLQLILEPRVRRVRIQHLSPGRSHVHFGLFKFLPQGQDVILISSQLIVLLLQLRLGIVQVPLEGLFSARLSVPACLGVQVVILALFSLSDLGVGN